MHQVLNKNLEHIVDDLAVGDFVAFSYSPVDNLNDIAKTPQEAIVDLKKMFEIVPNKKIALFEISWSTSDFVGGDSASQQLFLENLFDFYSENESEIEFMTWYRYSDNQIVHVLQKNKKLALKTSLLAAIQSLAVMSILLNDQITISATPVLLMLTEISNRDGLNFKIKST